MEIECPHCNEYNLVADEDVHATVECAFCQQDIHVSEKMAEKATTSLQFKKKEKSADPKKMETTARLSEEASLIKQRYAAPEADHKLLVRCPACAKSVSKKSDICVNCGHPIDERFFLKGAITRGFWTVIFWLHLLAAFYLIGFFILAGILKKLADMASGY